MMNVYNGNITTDNTGIADVVLPEYFEALNRDFRYQLTVIGEFAQAIVYDKINNNHFVIMTDKPNVEVSWQITGIRRDAYANSNITWILRGSEAFILVNESLFKSTSLTY